MYVVTAGCVDVKDRSCMAECPVDCLYEGEEMMYIQPDECIDCGACEAVCPADAIYFARDLPDDLRAYADVNRSAFDALGSPGGSAHVPHLLADPPRPGPSDG